MSEYQKRKAVDVSRIILGRQTKKAMGILYAKGGSP
jgi:hypothetical protein